MEKSDRELVLEKVDSLKEQLIEDVCKVVQIPSVTGDEGKAQEHIKKLYENLGLEVDVFEADYDTLKKHPTYIESIPNFENRPNVIGKLKGTGEGRSLILNGHIDVVSPEPFASWSFDPWGGIVDNGRIYGRGSMDMKGGLIANYYALKAVMESGFKPKGDVILQSVIEEELGGGGGALACFLKGYTGGGFITTEPNRLGVGHPGINYFKVKIKGKPTHAAISHLGVSAAEKGFIIFQALTELDRIRAERQRFPLAEKVAGRSCNLNIGIFSAGDWTSTVPSSAELSVRISYTPDETKEDVVNEVEKCIMEAARRDPWLSENLPEIEWFGWDAAPWFQDVNDTFVQQFVKVSEGVLGEKPEFVAFPGGLDNRFAQEFNVPSLSFGPVGGNLHGFDEYVTIDSVFETTQIIALMILEWCGYEK